MASLPGVLDTFIKGLWSEGTESFQCLKQKFLDHMKGFQNYDEQLLLPKEAFFNRLTGSHISDYDYQYAIQVFDLLKRKTIVEYSEYYLQTDARRCDGQCRRYVFENY